MDRKGLKPWLFGHSWGGVLAVEYAKRLQHKLAGVCLLGTGLSSSQWFRFRSDLEARGLEDAPAEKILLAPGEAGKGRKVFR